VSFGILHLAPLWPRFLQAYPEVQLDVSLIDRVVDIVEEGYDLAIRISRAGSASHAARKLASSRTWSAPRPNTCGAMACRSGRRICAATSASTTPIRRWATSGSSSMPRAGRERQAELRAAHQQRRHGACRRARRPGADLVADLPHRRRPAHRPPGELLPGWRMTDIDVLALYPSRRHLSAKVRVMVDFLAEAFRGVRPGSRPHGLKKTGALPTLPLPVVPPSPRIAK